MAGTESNRKWRQAVAMAAAALLVAQVLLALASWLLLSIRNSQLSIANCQLSIFNCHRSLLSGQGVRWLAAHFVDGLQSPLLVWLLLAAAAAGCLVSAAQMPIVNCQLSITHAPLPSSSLPSTCLSSYYSPPRPMLSSSRPQATCGRRPSVWLWCPLSVWGPSSQP